MKKIILSGVAVMAVGAVGIAAFIWSGLYNVAASRGHFAITHWLLEVGMRRSVETHAFGIDAPALDDPALFERGIGHFQGNCAPCHGAPGFPPSAVAQQMLPAPPDLTNAARSWKPHQLFWIVKHGLKYTGMPAWPAPSRDDEVWALVSVLVRLPDLKVAEYQRLAFADGGDVPAQHTTVVGFTKGDPIACVRCHGPNGEGSKTGGVPRIAGQKAEYLTMALSDYALGNRPSGIMGPVAIYIDDDQKQKLAQYYSSLGSGSALNIDEGKNSAVAKPELLQLGGKIAAEGVPSRSIPACDACHGPNGRAEGKNPRYPALAGQHFAYLDQQLKLYRSGARGGTFDGIMSMVVRNMTDEQARAVSLYYANLSRE